MPLPHEEDHGHRGHVWIKSDNEAYEEADVLGRRGDSYEVLTQRGKTVVVPSIKIFPFSSDAVQGTGVADTTQLRYISPASLLFNLETRHKVDSIYTFCGSVLIAVNPNQPVPLYSDSHLRTYVHQKFGRRPPHVYAIAERAYFLMKARGIDQGLIVSGESGAGKTETAKIAMNYLADRSKGDAANEIVRARVMSSNAILEAFGNAKTVRNWNSSRFGKLTELLFDDAFRLVGAAINTYLLEKSRVVHQDVSERNYHIFYFLLAGLPAAHRDRLHLGSAENYRYLMCGQCFQIEGVDDVQHFKKVLDAFQAFSIDEQEQQQIFQVLAAILHLGNLEFLHDEVSDAACLSSRSRQGLVYVCQALGIPDGESLLQGLLRRKVVGAVYQNLHVQEAYEQRDSFAKLLYENLFLRLVERINSALAPPAEPRHRISILDIFGFENQKVNSFEQLCINLANEKLHQLRTQIIFKMEEELYAREGIEVPKVPFRDNEDIIDVIEGAPSKRLQGIFDILTEHCRMKRNLMPDGTDAHFCMEVNRSLADRLKRVPRLKESDAFIVSHYAGDVEYSGRDFLAKNSDSLSRELRDLESTSPFVRSVLSLSQDREDEPGSAASTPRPSTPPATPTGRSRAQSAATAFFNAQATALGFISPNARKSNPKSSFSCITNTYRVDLASLITNLQSKGLHFVWCLKSNAQQRPRKFTRVEVDAQLTAMGLVHAIQIIKDGYPVRIPYDKVINKVLVSFPKAMGRRIRHSRRKCKRILEVLMPLLGVEQDGVQLGHTMVFCRIQSLPVIDDLSDESQPLDPYLVNVLARRYIQEQWLLAYRVHVLKLKVLDIVYYRRSQATLICAVCRMFICHKQLLRLKNRAAAATLLCSVFRMHLARRLLYRSVAMRYRAASRISLAYLKYRRHMSIRSAVHGALQTFRRQRSLRAPPKQTAQEPVHPHQFAPGPILISDTGMPIFHEATPITPAVTVTIRVTLPETTSLSAPSPVIMSDSGHPVGSGAADPVPTLGTMSSSYTSPGPSPTDRSYDDTTWGRRPKKLEKKSKSKDKGKKYPAEEDPQSQSIQAMKKRSSLIASASYLKKCVHRMQGKRPAEADHADADPDTTDLISPKGPGSSPLASPELGSLPPKYPTQPRSHTRPPPSIKQWGRRKSRSMVLKDSSAGPSSQLSVSPFRDTTPYDAYEDNSTGRDNRSPTTDTRSFTRSPSRTGNAPSEEPPSLSTGDGLNVTIGADPPPSPLSPFSQPSTPSNKSRTTRKKRMAGIRALRTIFEAVKDTTREAKGFFFPKSKRRNREIPQPHPRP